MLEPWYCTLEEVKRTLDFQEPARSDTSLRRAIGGASRGIEGLTLRKFYPWEGTRYFDWPNYSGAPSWRIYLDEHELTSVTALVSGGTTIAPASYILGPDNAATRGEPYTRLDINLGTSAAFNSGTSTWQKSIGLTGVFNYCADTTAAGALDGSVTDSASAITVTNGAAIGVGDSIKVESERMIVTDRSFVDSGQNLGGSGVTAAVSDQVLTVTTGTEFAADEILLIGAERMRIDTIAGNTLIVKRAVEGSTLAAHSNGADIYASRTLTVYRGAQGTTVASHGDGTAVARHLVPDLVRELAVAESIATFLQGASGYARSISTSDQIKEVTGRGLIDVRARVEQRYARAGRKLAV
jgi:hypothetical protein